MMLQNLRKEIADHRDPEKAKILQRFFKTGPGEYAEGDVFLGIVVPQQRKIARQYAALNIGDAEALFHSKIHEERLIALLILVQRFKKADPATREAIYRLYLRNTNYINNWDLVDLTADHIVGAFLNSKPRNILNKLAKSKNLWERRIAILATFHYIKQGESAQTLKIASLLLHDEHDLIHKAVGWMLREVGKRCSQEEEEQFLKEHYRMMPRTMLRYAIERFPEQLRLRYLRDSFR